MLESRTKASQSLQGMKDRQEEVFKLERSTKELHEMFLDISFLVDQQGYTIDRVEEYVDSSREATQQAAVVMQEVVVKQRKAQRRRWFFAGIGGVILIVLVVIIVLALTNRL
jgi:t-SNARE complex subunit (syntaxin)